MDINKMKQLFKEGALLNEAGEKVTKPDFIHLMYKQHHCLWEYAELIRGTEISRIVIEDGQVWAKLREQGLMILCRENDERSMPMDILNFDTYERRERELTIKILGMLERRNILDIGANIGYMSLIWENSFQDCVIHAFEPIPETFRTMRENLKRNHSGRIFAHNYGLSDEEKEIEFYYFPWCIANTSIKNLQHRQDASLVSAWVKRYDDLEEFKETPIDFVKCDVEGNEKNVFLGMKESLERWKPAICTELLRKFASQFQYHPNDVLKLLGEELHYRCFKIAGGGDTLQEIHDFDTEEASNFFFLHADKHNKIIRELEGA